MGKFNFVLKNLRIAKDLTQEQLAKELNVSRSTIGMYENASREPDYETLEKIADYFNVDIDYLIGRTNKTTIIPESYFSHQDDTPKILQHYNKLNEIGKQEAVKRVEELTYIPLYSNETDAVFLNAAHSLDNATNEEKTNDENIMNDENF